MGGPQRERVVLNCHWRHNWPLWTPDSDETYDAAPDGLGLSAGLAAELRIFYEFWEQRCTPSRGWESLQDCVHAQAEAARLVGLLAGELSGRYVVENDFRRSFHCGIASN